MRYPGVYRELYLSIHNKGAHRLAEMQEGEAMSSSEAELSRREPVVRLKSISKEFPGVLAVDGVDLEILSGEVHVVAGENGAGKSTLLRYGAGAGRDRGGRHRGASLFGGQGTVVGTLIGAFLIALILNSAVLLDVNTFYSR